jgi:hypothetical protein
MAQGEPNKGLAWEQKKAYEDTIDVLKRQIKNIKEQPYD